MGAMGNASQRSASRRGSFKIKAHKWSSVLASSVTQPGEVSYLSGTQEPFLLHIISRGGEGDKTCSYSGGSGVGSAASTLASAITPNASLFIYFCKLIRGLCNLLHFIRTEKYQSVRE